MYLRVFDCLVFLRERRTIVPPPNSRDVTNKRFTLRQVASTERTGRGGSGSEVDLTPPIPHTFLHTNLTSSLIVRAGLREPWGTPQCLAPEMLRGRGYGPQVRPPPP